MRCLVLTAAYPSPAEPERAIFIENLNRALLDVAKGELEIRVVAPRVHAADPLVEERRGMTVFRFRYPSGGRRPKESAKLRWTQLGTYFASGLQRSLSLLAREGCDLLVAHWILPTGVIAAAVSRMMQIPLVLYAHGSDLNRFARRFPGKFLCAWSLLEARGVFAVSRDLARILRQEHDVAGERVRILPMGVGPEFTPGDRDAERRELGLGDFFELLYVGDLTAEKGLEDLLGALEILRRDGVRPRLHVIGDGPLAPRIAEFAERPGHGADGAPPLAVRFLGRLPPREVARWYRGVDLYVHPSHSEGTPVAIMEAQSSGLPAVCTAVGGVPDVVTEGATGLLVAPRDPRALAGAIKSLVEDRGSLEAMRSGLRGDLPDHSADARARRLLLLLAEVGCVIPY